MTHKLVDSLVELAEQVVSSKHGMKMDLTNCTRIGTLDIEWSKTHGFWAGLDIQEDGGYIPATRYQPGEAVAIDIAYEQIETHKISELAMWVNYHGFTL